MVPDQDVVARFAVRYVRLFRCCSIVYTPRVMVLRLWFLHQNSDADLGFYCGSTLGGDKDFHTMGNGTCGEKFVLIVNYGIKREWNLYTLWRAVDTKML